MPDISPSIPVAGQPNSTEEPKIVTALTQLVSAVNNVDSAQISATAGILDTQLASPNNAVWRTIQSWPFRVVGSVAAGVVLYPLGDGNMGTSGSAINAEIYTIPWHFFVPADYAVTGRTLEARLIYSLHQQNGYSSTLTLGFYQPAATFGGTNTAQVITLGTAIGSSTATTSTLSSIGYYNGASVAFTPTSGVIIPGVTVTSTPPSTCTAHGTVGLQIRHT